jgi:hypothetical protein
VLATGVSPAGASVACAHVQVNMSEMSTQNTEGAVDLPLGPCGSAVEALALLPGARAAAQSLRTERQQDIRKFCIVCALQ